MMQVQQKPYSVEKGREFIDWNRVLDNWSELTLMQRWEYYSRAQDWVTCACGNQCSIIPRDVIGAPKDFKLRMLGSEFPTYLHPHRPSDGIPAAKRTLQEIEKRSTELIKEILMNNETG